MTDPIEITCPTKVSKFHNQGSSPVWIQLTDSANTGLHTFQKTYLDPTFSAFPAATSTHVYLLNPSDRSLSDVGNQKTLGTLPESENWVFQAVCQMNGTLYALTTKNENCWLNSLDPEDAIVNNHIMMVGSNESNYSIAATNAHIFLNRDSKLFIYDPAIDEYTQLHQYNSGEAILAAAGDRLFACSATGIIEIDIETGNAIRTILSLSTISYDIKQMTLVEGLPNEEGLDKSYFLYFTGVEGSEQSLHLINLDEDPSEGEEFTVVDMDWVPMNVIALFGAPWPSGQLITLVNLPEYSLKVRRINPTLNTWMYVPEQSGSKPLILPNLEYEIYEQNSGESSNLIFKANNFLTDAQTMQVFFAETNTCSEEIDDQKYLLDKQYSYDDPDGNFTEICPVFPGEPHLEPNELGINLDLSGGIIIIGAIDLDPTAISIS